MPIVDVEIIGHMDSKEGLAQQLADAAGKVLHTGSGHTWVKLRFLPADQYAENGETSADLNPVFVSLLLGSAKSMEEKIQIAPALAEAFSRTLGRPANNIHVLFEPEVIGRIAFGGRLRTK